MILHSNPKTICLGLGDNDVGKLWLLDKQLRSLNRAILTHGGTISHTKAEAHAKAEYAKFDKRRREVRAEQPQRELQALKGAAREIRMIGGNLKRKRTKSGG